MFNNLKQSLELKKEKSESWQFDQKILEENLKKLDNILGDQLEVEKEEQGNLEEIKQWLQEDSFKSLDENGEIYLVDGIIYRKMKQFIDSYEKGQGVVYKKMEDIYQKIKESLIDEEKQSLFQQQVSQKEEFERKYKEQQRKIDQLVKENIFFQEQLNNQIQSQEINILQNNQFMVNEGVLEREKSVQKVQKKVFQEDVQENWKVLKLQAKCDNLELLLGQFQRKREVEVQKEDEVLQDKSVFESDLKRLREQLDQSEQMEKIINGLIDLDSENILLKSIELVYEKKNLQKRLSEQEQIKKEIEREVQILKENLRLKEEVKEKVEGNVQKILKRVEYFEKELREREEEFKYLVERIENLENEKKEKELECQQKEEFWQEEKRKMEIEIEKSEERNQNIKKDRVSKRVYQELQNNFQNKMEKMNQIISGLQKQLKNEKIESQIWQQKNQQNEQEIQEILEIRDRNPYDERSIQEKIKDEFKKKYQQVYLQNKELEKKILILERKNLFGATNYENLDNQNSFSKKIKLDTTLYLAQQLEETQKQNNTLQKSNQQLRILNNQTPLASHDSSEIQSLNIESNQLEALEEFENNMEKIKYLSKISNTLNQLDWKPVQKIKNSFEQEPFIEFLEQKNQ